MELGSNAWVQALKSQLPLEVSTSMPSSLGSASSSLARVNHIHVKSDIRSSGWIQSS